MTNRFPDLKAEILQGLSIGGICIGDDINTVLSCLAEDCPVSSDYFFAPDGRCLMWYCFYDGAVSLTADEDGVILDVRCRKPYRGLFDGRIGPGMTAAEIAKFSRHQEECYGYLVLDNNYQIYLSLPDGCDDFERFSDLPEDIVFEQLYVGNLLG